MIKYVMTAVALKAFSVSPQTKRLYRQIGNVIDQRRRIQEGLNRYYIDRSKKLHQFCEKHHVIQDGNRVLEVGTGWVHWDSTLMRLLYDVDITMFDVWDNRYLGLYKQYFSQFEEIIDRELELDAKQSERVHALLRAILEASSFDEIYDLLGLRYVLHPNGTLEQFPDESFDLIFSCDVLEHIKKGVLPEFIQGFYRVLKPGGYCIHQIDLTDHLYYYDTRVSPKNYLRYSDRTWRHYFENNAQYINRVQRPEWLELFQKAGLEMVEEESVAADIGTRRVDKGYENRYLPYNAIYNGHNTGMSTIKVDKRYENLSRQDLECVALRVAHRKPYG